MEINVTDQKALTLVGMKYRGDTSQGQIPVLWGKFSPRIEEIPDNAGTYAAYGWMDNFDEATKEFDYVACVQVKSADKLPEGMIVVEIPAGQFAVITCTLPQIMEAYEELHNKWLPDSGYKRRVGPEFEYYPPEFHPENPRSTMDICIPVEKA